MDFVQLTYIVILIEALTQITTKADIFSKIRLKLTEVSEFWGQLVTCGYCSSFWWAAIINLFLYILTIPIIFLNTNTLINYLVSVIICHRLSNYMHGISDRYLDTNKDIRYKNKE